MTKPTDHTAALRLLCDQLDGMKRTMFLRPGTGQNYSYLVHEDVAAYVEQARRALETPAALPAVYLTRDQLGMCEVSLEVDGQWVSVIQDNGDIISHIVEQLGVRLALERAGLQAPAVNVDQVRQLPPLNDDLRNILGRPNFSCAQLAELLRLTGQSIKHKAEDEQAAVIHFLLNFYLVYGAKWGEAADAEIKRLVTKARAGAHG